MIIVYIFFAAIFFLIGSNISLILCILRTKDNLKRDASIVLREEWRKQITEKLEEILEEKK